MRLYELIESENTDGQFDRWSEYRRELTDIICDVITKDTEKYFYEEKPTLAIWGAGGCNDIDIGRLSKLSKLVLIDCEKSRTKKAIEKYGLDKSQTVAADLFFYDIPYECYEHWEELLRDGADTGTLHSFLSELLLEAVSTDMMTLPGFEYSVAVGITSQLNARLAALLYLYHDNYRQSELEELLDHISILDEKAVDRLYDIVSKTTKEKIIWGYEDSIVGIGEEGQQLHIRANQRLRSHMAENDVSRELLWHFTEEKTYNMKLFITDGR